MPKLINLNQMAPRQRRPERSELPPWEPGGSAIRVLKILNEYRYLTPDLLGLVYAARQRQGKGESHVRHELTRLWRYGYVERFHRPAEWGSNEYVYALAVAGAQLVIGPKDWPDERRRVYNAAKRKVNYEHALAVSLVHALWELGAPSQERVFRTVTTWQDKQGNARRVLNEFAAEVDGKKVTLQPDFTVLIAHHELGFYRPYFFEIERTHKNHDRLRERLRAYGYLLSAVGEGAVGKVFQREEDINPARGLVVFVAADRPAAERLREMAISLCKESATSMVSVDTEMWFTSLDQLLVERLRTRADGTPFLDRRGEPQRREVPIDAAAFFTKPILTALDGKHGRLVV